MAARGPQGNTYRTTAVHRRADTRVCNGSLVGVAAAQRVDRDSLFIAPRLRRVRGLHCTALHAGTHGGSDRSGRWGLRSGRRVVCCAACAAKGWVCISGCDSSAAIESSRPSCARSWRATRRSGSCADQRARSRLTPHDPRPAPAAAARTSDPTAPHATRRHGGLWIHVGLAHARLRR